MGQRVRQPGAGLLGAAWRRRGKTGRSAQEAQAAHPRRKLTTDQVDTCQVLVWKFPEIATTDDCFLSFYNLEHRVPEHERRIGNEAYVCIADAFEPPPPPAPPMPPSPPPPSPPRGLIVPVRDLAAVYPVAGATCTWPNEVVTFDNGIDAPAFPMLFAYDDRGYDPSQTQEHSQGCVTTIPDPLPLDLVPVRMPSPLIPEYPPELRPGRDDLFDTYTADGGVTNYLTVRLNRYINFLTSGDMETVYCIAFYRSGALTAQEAIQDRDRYAVRTVYVDDSHVDQGIPFDPDYLWPIFMSDMICTHPSPPPDPSPPPPSPPPPSPPGFNDCHINCMAYCTAQPGAGYGASSCAAPPGGCVPPDGSPAGTTAGTVANKDPCNVDGDCCSGHCWGPDSYSSYDYDQRQTRCRENPNRRRLNHQGTVGDTNGDGLIDACYDECDAHCTTECTNDFGFNYVVRGMPPPPPPHGSLAVVDIELEVPAHSSASLQCTPEKILKFPDGANLGPQYPLLYYYATDSNSAADSCEEFYVEVPAFSGGSWVPVELQADQLPDLPAGVTGTFDAWPHMHADGVTKHYLRVSHTHSAGSANCMLYYRQPSIFTGRDVTDAYADIDSTWPAVALDGSPVVPSCS